MKFLSLVLVAALGIAPLAAQQATIVQNGERSQYENTSYLVVESLVLKPGFQFNSATQGTFFARTHNTSPTKAPSEGKAFVRSEHVRVEGITNDEGVISLPIGSKRVAYSYFDGMGRPIQSLQVQGSPGKQDLVQPVAYDAKQRASISYLPYRAAASTGAFRPSALSEQLGFYDSPPPGVTGDTKPYSNATYEDSPLDRVVGVSQLGNDLQTAYTSSKVKVNISTDAVRRWAIVNGRPNSSSTYPINSLSVAETVDAELHITRTFSDFAGRTVLVRTQAGASTWLDTYYVYNDYSELIFVIPPQSSTTLAPSQAHVDLWHFQYAYDEFSRQTGTKAPGAGWVYTIYDKWDRPVLTQDGEQRAKATPEWSYVKYDIHNRPVVIGTIANGTALATLRTQVAASTASRFETRNNSALGYTIGSSYPTTAVDAGILSITYYDDYTFMNHNSWASGTGNSNGLYAFAAESGYFTLQQQNMAVKGLATGSKSRRQGNSTEWINSVTYYDTYYQPIQTISTHQLTGTVKTSTLYAFSGEVEKTVNTYSYSGGTTRVERRFTYDHAGRPLKVYHKINGNAEVMLGHFQYNELGEATEIIHHSRNNGNTWLYRTGLKSTIQGWTDEILYTYSNGDPVFRQKLDYHKASGTANSPRLDGIITSNQWKHYGTEPERAYNYTFDTPKRLTGSIYRQKIGSTWNTDGNFNESHISYSANGNITALRRNRDNGGTVVQMDQLTYTYTGNQLTAVADAAPAAHKAGGFNDGNTGTDYTYNQNGFLLTDANKGVTGITYTRQNLPAQINFGSTNRIKYTYSAGGGLMTVEYSGTGAFADRTQHYVGELVFEGTVLKEIRHEYGRVLADAGYRYQYYLTDHLGNTRVVLQEDPANFTVLATFEPDNLETESMQFMDYGEAPHIASSLFDHTGTSETGYALRLTNGETGPSRSVAVLPGDTVRMEVFAKYLDLNNKKLDPALMMLSLAIEAANPGSLGIDGNLSTPSSRIAVTDQGLAGLLVGKESRSDAPPAYLNYLFFDKEMNYKYGGYTQMTEAAYEDGTNREHERLYQEVVADEPGYFYIYLSNDGTEGGEAYFDDFSILTLESYIVQQTDYYPYGLIARNFVRENEKETRELFQGKTYDELTGWYDFHARQYDAALGRWFGVDAYTHRMPGVSPFNAMANNPVMFLDPDGNEPITLAVLGLAMLKGALIGTATSAAVYSATYLASGMSGSGQFWNGFGNAVAMGAVTGAIGGGIGGAFANSAFSQTLGYNLLNSTSSTVAGNLILGNEISLGTVIGGIAGGFAGAGLPQFSGVKGGALANIGAEIGYGAVKGAATGAVTGGIGSAIDKQNIGDGIKQGALAGAVGGATMGALNIAAMGPSLYSGPMGRNTPVFRSGGLFTLHLAKGDGITIGRNLVVKESGDFIDDAGLRFHEYVHFIQQRTYGSGNFYSRILSEYYQSGKGSGKWYFSYFTPGHLENQAMQLELLFKHFLPFKIK